MIQHFVTFFSPGTFVAEQTTMPIVSWDVETAQAMSRTIVERYDARPYGFQFSTRSRNEDELDSRTTATSSMYFLGGKVETLADVKARSSGRDSILIANMEGNGWDRVITTATPWGWTQPLNPNDVVLQEEK